MAQGTSLYRFRLAVSDIDRAFYENLDFRLALHPSESFDFLLCRMIAYALNYQEGLQFSPKGLGDPEDPCMSLDDPRGGKALWIEIGNPSARRLHKAAKASKIVKVYTYKNPEMLVREIESEKVHNSHLMEIFSLEPSFLEKLEAALERDNEWGLIRDQESLMIQIGEESFSGDLKAHRAH